MAQENFSRTEKQVNNNEPISAGSTRKDFPSFSTKEHPAFNQDSFVSIEALRAYRKKYLECIMEDEMGELDKVEKEVLDAISKQGFISANVEANDDERYTFSQRLADSVAMFGGSWAFIVLFAIIILCWIVINSDLMTKGFDPYPYILLNLILSCVAALQAPVIMMSQNRKEAKDRARSEHDYKVNLKAELEIRLLHEKMDHLMIFQTQRILEMQQIQLDRLEKVIGEKPNEKGDRQHS